MRDVHRLIADEVLDFCRHYLATSRRYRDHVLTEPEERVLTDTSMSGASAWRRARSWRPTWSSD